ncbi:hypothetical protein ACM0P6_02320 [Komagataeibacter sucrofermentans]|uniref:Uncharacterized protein n=1 Tax=Komagataeibacter sucrofermentans TaxID=1053551 RepID=A0A318QEI9_9PROT|nr:hypothetical protein [Komagataeibacter sucrofermentans]PYD78036.1 hypothetical protein CFR77_12600 [Komagataeibacter sucrofermentans]
MLQSNLFDMPLISGFGYPKQGSRNFFRFSLTAGEGARSLSGIGSHAGNQRQRVELITDADPERGLFKQPLIETPTNVSDRHTSGMSAANQKQRMCHAGFFRVG